MDNEIKHTIEFGEKTLSALAALTQAIKENTKLLEVGNPDEFSREVCANIYADMIISSLFPNRFNNPL